MFSTFRNFVSRNKRKFFITAVVFGASGVVLHYVRKKLFEFQETQAREFIEKTRRIQHFESTERTCNQAIQSLFPNVLEVVSKLYDTNTILQELREKSQKLTTVEKIDLWNQLLVKSFSRIVTLVYSLTILVISLRVQLNILAGFIYKEIDKDMKTISQELQNNYLSCIQHFLKDGVTDLALTVQNITKRIFEKYDFKQKLDLSELEQIFWSIQMSINQKLQQSNDNSLVSILFPSEDEVNGDILLKKLLNETVDMLETDEVFGILTNHLGLGFSATTDEIANFFSSTASINTTNNNHGELQNRMIQNNKLINITQVKVPLAKLIPIIDGLTPKTVSQQPLLNNLLNMLINSEKIKMLGANTYEVFSQ